MFDERRSIRGAVRRQRPRPQDQSQDRFAANLGLPVHQPSNLGVQLGVALNLSDAAVHVLDQVEGTSRRTQTYLTMGVFQRPTPKWSWGVAYDFLFQDYYDAFHLGQWRGQAGYKLTERYEVGTWFSKSARGADGQMGDTPVRLDPIGQINGYTRVTWTNWAQTAVWAGVASGHHNVVWVFPDNSRDRYTLVYGADVYVPLSEAVRPDGRGELPDADVDRHGGHVSRHRVLHGEGRVPRGAQPLRPPPARGEQPLVPGQSSAIADILRPVSF